MADGATAKYLAENIMTINGQPVLSRALAEMAVAQPADGVNFLSKWLQTFAEQEEAKQWRGREEALLKEEREKTQQILENQESRKKAKEKADQDVETLYDNLLAKFNDPETVFTNTGSGDGMWQELVDVVKKVCNVEAAYLGSLVSEGMENPDAGPFIMYDSASTGSEWMVAEKTLAQGVGVTWAALEESPPDEAFAPDAEVKKYFWRPPEETAPVPEPAEGEEPVERPRLKYYPVNIPCVTDVDSVHYFDMTRLGAYVAVPLVYTSYYSPDAIEEARKFEEEKKTEAAARKEAEEAKEAAEEAEQEVPPEVLEKLSAEVEEKQMVLPGFEEKRVLCFDTLGTNRYIDEARIPQILALCKACAECKARTEIKQVDEQAIEQIDTTKAQTEEEELKELQTTIETADQEALTAEQGAAEEEDMKLVVEKKFAYSNARQLCAQKKEVIFALKSWVCCSKEVQNIVLGLALFFGVPKEKIYPRNKNVLQWEKLKYLLDEALLQSFEDKDLAEPRKGLKPDEKLSNIKSLIPAFDDEARAKDPCLRSGAVFMLHGLLTAACEYRTSHLDSLKAAYARKKAEAEEAGEEAVKEFKEPPPAELDDDIEE
jgi:hypothetical protein